MNPRPQYLKPTYFWGLIFALSLLLFLLYRLGMQAGFVLDDYGPLRHLEFGGGIDIFGEVVKFLKMGFGIGPAGRPVALLSFLPQADSWPHSSAPFLTVNVVIHILITGTLAGFLRTLFRAAGIQQADRIALFAATLWALHPWHVSTVLYAVQRMTSLAMLFSVLALWAYLPLRAALQQQRFWPSIGWSLGLGICSLMAFGSKESAVLIPQFLLVVEWLLGRNSNSRRSTWHCAWLVVFAWLPCIFVWLYLIRLGIDPQGYGHREFSVGERLLTEISVVGLYIQSLLIPKIVTPGLFYDSYTVVRNFFASPVTIFWAIAHLGILATAVAYRRRWPLFMFSVLWFYGGHLLESTTVPLELVFEHRNYMPSVGVLVLLAVGLDKLCERSMAGRWAVAGTLLLLIVILQQRVSFWGNPLERAVVWAETLPQSARAQENAFAVLYKADRIEAGDYYLARSIQMAPDDPYLKIKQLARDCEFRGQIGEFDWVELNRELGVAKTNFSLYRMLSGLLRQANAGNCKGLNTQKVDELISSALKNQEIQRSGIAGNLVQLRGELYLHNGNTEEAVHQFEEARRRMRETSVAIYQARLLAGNKQFVAAENILTELIENDSVDSYTREQAADVRKQIQKDMGAR